MATKKSKYDVLEQAVTEARAAITEAQRRYVEAREAYTAHRRELIKADPQVKLPWSVLQELDQVDLERREAVARSNAEIDAKAARGPQPLA